MREDVRAVVVAAAALVDNSGVCAGPRLVPKGVVAWFQGLVTGVLWEQRRPLFSRIFGRLGRHLPRRVRPARGLNEEFGGGMFVYSCVPGGGGGGVRAVRG